MDAKPRAAAGSGLWRNAVAQLAPDDRATVERISRQARHHGAQVIDGLRSARRALIFARQAAWL